MQRVNGREEFDESAVWFEMADWQWFVILVKLSQDLKTGHNYTVGL